MHKLFLSYSQKDKDRVSNLVRGLEAFGCEVWIDHHKLTGGQVWWDSVLRQLRDCDAVVVAVSNATLKSVACSSEYAYAAALGKGILPVRIENVSQKLLPEELRSRHVIDFYAGKPDEPYQLAKAVNALPKNVPLPSPMPRLPPLPVSNISKLRDQVNATSTLALEVQNRLISELSNMVQRGDDLQEVRQVLKDFRKRPDLYSVVQQRIDEVLNNYPKYRTSETTVSVGGVAAGGFEGVLAVLGRGALWFFGGAIANGIAQNACTSYDPYTGYYSAGCEGSALMLLIWGVGIFNTIELHKSRSK